MKTAPKSLVIPRLRRLLMALLCGATLVGPKQAQAIFDGTKDGNAHPYVGMIVFYDAEGTPLWRCTGTLLSSTLFLTAAHCTADDPGAIPFSARIYFSDEPVAGQNYVEATVVKNPGYSLLGSLPIPLVNDVTVVVLNEPVYMPHYGELATQGKLDELTGPAYKNLAFDVIGYGVQDIRPDVQAATVRYWATPKRVTDKSAMTGTYIHLSNNPGKINTGGPCSGDSGGPIFLAGTRIIVGVTSWVINGNCAGAGFGYRTDIADSLNFLAPFLVEPE